MGKNFFWSIGHCVKLVWTLSQKKTFSRKGSSRVVTTAICASIVAFFKKNHFFFYIDSYFPFVSGIWAISLSFSKKFSQEWQKCILSAQMKKFGGIYFWKKSDFHILFGLWTEKLQTFTGKNLNRNFEKHSTCPVDYLQSNFFERDNSKIQLLRILNEVLRKVAKTFFRVAKTAIIVPRNKLRKNLLESKKMQLLSRFWTNSLCHF